MEFLATITALILGFWLGTNHGDPGKNAVEKYSKAPYCQTDTAEVLGEKVTLKRCWKMVEVKE